MEKNLLSVVKNAGIVGAGGAGFPTHVKLEKNAEIVLINGAECEPLLRVDQNLMAVKTRELLEGLKLVIKEVDAKEGFIALKGKYKDAIKNITQIISEYENIKLHILDNFYPAGDEQVTVYEVTNRIVPEGGIPLDVGVIVLNVETTLNIFQAYYNSYNVTDKYVTVTGEVKNIKTVKVPIGITIEEVIALAGGSTVEDYVVINGGPMMGKLVDIKDVVTKTTKGLIVLRKEHPLIKDLTKDIKDTFKESRTACMHCSLCTEVCPRNMLGHRIYPNKLVRMESYVNENVSNEFVKNAFLCCECRLCEYACVMNLKPWQVNRYLKQTMINSGLKNTLNNKPEKTHPFREYKKFPVNRLISKLGLSKYDVKSNLEYIDEYKIESVKISLRQHIGAPSIPVVDVGNSVEKGDLIADVQDGKLGSKIHSSISGVVYEVNENSIIINRRK